MEKNIYDCPACGTRTVTRHATHGVTPFLIGCTKEGCPGMARSRFYLNIPTASKATHEWYRPEEEEFSTLSRQTKVHVERGGLLLRKIAEQEGTTQED